jgi:tRNA A37 threonylcarbamoyladenosine dehydratase
MSYEWLSRTNLLLGDEKIRMLNQKKVLIAGLGGVGGFAAECVCRAGIGEISLLDADKIELSNLNRQIISLHSNIGQSKVQAIQKRLIDINPNLKTRVFEFFLTPEKIALILEPEPDFIIDAIDTIEPKVCLIKKALEREIPIVSVMGAGGKINPELIQIADISGSRQCHLARNIRKRLYKEGIRSGFPVIFSTEKVDMNSVQLTRGLQNKKSSPGTISWMPPVFGAFAASVVIRELLRQE